VRLAFSTLGCPDWSLDQVAEAAGRFGYEAIELRCLGGDLDLSSRPELSAGEIARTRRRLADRGLEVCCVDTSACFHSPDDPERLANVDLALRFAEIAAGLGAPLIRVFPNEVPDGSARPETRRRIAAALHVLAERMPDGVRIGLETHGDFASGEETAEIARRADHPAVAIVWDAANTLAAGESIASAARAVAPYLALVHLKDARPRDGERFWQPVLAGRGRVPFGEVVAAVARVGYRGWLSFEWEKYWHPEIEEPEIAFADFAAAVAAC
jgi:sugar phosphate isomerase/epimerase